MRRQISALTQIGSSTAASLLNTETRLRLLKYSKSYYEPAMPDVIALIPEGTRSVLSIGCGSGATELQLVEKGLRVVAVPLDSVISGNAAEKGVEMVQGDLPTARATLDAQRFDCLLFLNVLHLVQDPVEVLSSFSETLLSNSVVIIHSPNMAFIRNIFEKIRDTWCLWNSSSYELTGVHFTSVGTVRRWCRRAGLRTTESSTPFSS